MPVFGGMSPFDSLSPFGSLVVSSTPTDQPTTLRQAIHKRLSTDTALASLVGTRITANGRPQGDGSPSITLGVAGTSRPYALTGLPSLKQSRFRVSCWGSAYDVVEQTALAVTQRLEGFRGNIGSVSVQGVFLQNEIDMPESPTGGKGVLFYRIVLDFSITYSGA